MRHYGDFSSNSSFSLLLFVFWLLFAIVFRSVGSECGLIPHGYWGRDDACHKRLSAVRVSFMGLEFDDCFGLGYHLMFTNC